MALRRLAELGGTKTMAISEPLDQLCVCVVVKSRITARPIYRENASSVALVHYNLVGSGAAQRWSGWMIPTTASSLAYKTTSSSAQFAHEIYNSSRLNTGSSERQVMKPDTLLLIISKRASSISILLIRRNLLGSYMYDTNLMMWRRI